MITNNPILFLPGPVSLSPAVRSVLSEPPLSHRSPEFHQRFACVRDRLLTLTNAKHVQLLPGGGTLANDLIAAQISLLQKPGIIAANGEFGERLMDHANRFHLAYTPIISALGDKLDYQRLRETCRNVNAAWLWAVHGETSTGVLNNLYLLRNIAADNRAVLCLDAVSSLGNVPVDLNGVAFASGVSGKGLAAPPGLALVFHAQHIRVSQCLPKSLDLGIYAKGDGIPHTLPAQLVAALETSLREIDNPHYDRICSLHEEIRRGIRNLPLKAIGDPDSTFPGILTIELPESLNSCDIGTNLASHGFQIHFRSHYLISRNWIQISTMGATHTAQGVRELLNRLRSSLTRSRVPDPRPEFQRV